MTKILIVDDEVGMRSSSRIFLQKDRGYEVVEATNGQEGLDVLLAQSPDLVILDSVMPEYNGHYFSKAVRTDPRYCAHIAIPILGNGSFNPNEVEYLNEWNQKATFNRPEFVSKVESLLGAEHPRLKEWYVDHIAKYIHQEVPDLNFLNPATETRVIGETMSKLNLQDRFQHTELLTMVNQKLRTYHQG